MKISVNTTTIEAKTEDLKASNSIAESFSNLIRRAFNNACTADQCEEGEEDETTE